MRIYPSLWRLSTYKDRRIDNYITQTSHIKDGRSGLVCFQLKYSVLITKQFIINYYLLVNDKYL